ncbi:hypothetical protein BC941DRAFT_510909 [Chlamydoabsidia padenii]|nr:hypothetical protein BC941DRAFT_510909 [Chlamydoabsidia padenii]
MDQDSTSKMDLLKSKCDAVISCMRNRTPLVYKGHTAYASFQPPPSDMDNTNENAYVYDEQYWAPPPPTAKLDRHSLMTKHHFVAEPEWLPPVQSVQHRVPRPHSRGVKLRSVEAIVNDTQRQKALSKDERGQYSTIKMPPRQQQQQQPTPKQPAPPKSKVLDFIDEIKAVSRNSSSNSSTPNKFGHTPNSTTQSQNGNLKKQQQQNSVPSKRPSDTQNRQTLKKRTQPSTTTATTTTPLASTPTAVSTPRSAPRPLVAEKASSKTPDAVTKSKHISSDANLDLLMTKQYLINDLNDPAATRHLEDLSSLNVVTKRPVLRVKVKLPKSKKETRSKEVTMKPKNDTQASPVVTGDGSIFNLPTGTIPTEFIRSMKIRKKSKSDQPATITAGPLSSSPTTASVPAPTPTASTKTSRSHVVELEEGETISPSPSPKRAPSLSPERPTSKSTHKRHRDSGGTEDHDQQKQHTRRNKVSRKEVSVPLSSSSSASSATSTTTSRHTTAHDNGDDRQHHGSPTTGSKSVSRKDRYSTIEDDRKSNSTSSKRLERTISGGDDSSSSDRRRSRYSGSSSSRHSRDEETSRHRSSQRSSGSRQRRSSRSMSRSRSPHRRSSSSSSHTRSTSQDKYRRHAPSATTATTTTTGSSSVNKDKLTPSVLNGPTTPKDLRTKEAAPTPTTSVLSPAIIKKESSISSPAIIKKESRDNSTPKTTTNNQKAQPPATAKNAETHDQYRVFYKMFNKLALTYKRRGDQAETEICGLLDHMHAFSNYMLTFYYQDLAQTDHQVEQSWETLIPFGTVLLNKLRKNKRYELLYGLCLRMMSLVQFHLFHRREKLTKYKMGRLCEKNGDGFDEAKRIDYSTAVYKVLQYHESAYQNLRDSDRYMAYEAVQDKFPVSFENVCIQGQLGAGIVLGGEAGVTVGPMFPLVPYARMNHAAIMVKCLLQEFVDKENIDYHAITDVGDFM